MAHLFDVARTAHISFVAGGDYKVDSDTLTYRDQQLKDGADATLDPANNRLLIGRQSIQQGNSPVLKDIEFLTATTPDLAICPR